jgi:hypothetical protein
MKRIAVFAAGWLVLGAATADALPSPQNTEHLIMPPYPSATPWQKITDGSNGELTQREWIPADQTVASIKDILTEQEFPKLKGMDPAVFAGGLLKRMASRCADARLNGPKAGEQNGYPVAYGQFYCVRWGDTGQDVDIFLKVIGGHDALYVAQVEFRRPTTPGAHAGITSFTQAQMAQMKARLEAMGTASHYLSDSVQLRAQEDPLGAAATGTP